ncbi:hypothetical protein F2Q69_00047819 [Brassica cretica]|uniref:Uncharacterized protein n=1 Tax=Brassica cretica TaxID=69181 RepID=A0A8S9PPU1_BRACR|nr:hypothetical protein F2Q69_00047819 [Brassica cretica]
MAASKAFYCVVPSYENSEFDLETSRTTLVFSEMQFCLFSVLLAYFPFLFSCMFTIFDIGVHPLKLDIYLPNLTVIFSLDTTSIFIKRSSKAGFRARPRFTLGLRLCGDKSAFVLHVCDFNLIRTDIKSANLYRLIRLVLIRFELPPKVVWRC